MRHQEAHGCRKDVCDFVHNVIDDGGVDKRVFVEDANIIIIFKRIKYSSDIIVFYIITQIVECCVNDKLIVNI